MTGNPFDGLGRQIKKSIKEKLREVFTGKRRCNVCKTKTKMNELRKDFINGYLCPKCFSDDYWYNTKTKKHVRR